MLMGYLDADVKFYFTILIILPIFYYRQSNEIGQGDAVHIPGQTVRSPVRQGQCEVGEADVGHEPAGISQLLLTLPTSFILHLTCYILETSEFRQDFSS